MSDGLYSIGEVSKKLNIEQYTLRYWEKEFRDFVKPRRTSNKQNRVYTEEDIRVLRTIDNLLHVDLYTIAGARRQLYLRAASTAAE